MADPFANTLAEARAEHDRAIEDAQSYFRENVRRVRAACESVFDPLGILGGPADPKTQARARRRLDAEVRYQRRFLDLSEMHADTRLEWDVAAAFALRSRMSMTSQIKRADAHNRRPTAMKPHNYKSLLARAVAEFPGCFSERQPKPLAVGIGEVLSLVWRPDVPAKHVSRFLGFYTGRRSYRLAVAAGGPRFYLDGSVDGEVTPADRERARERLAEDEVRAAAQFDAAALAFQERRQARKAELDAAIKAFRQELAPEPVRPQGRPKPARNQVMRAMEVVSIKRRVPVPPRAQPGL